jgi:hypothetical protein
MAIVVRPKHTPKDPKHTPKDTKHTPRHTCASLWFVAVHCAWFGEAQSEAQDAQEAQEAQDAHFSSANGRF